MKYLILLLTIAAVQGGEDISKYKPGWMRNPTLVKMHEGDKCGIIGGHEAVPHSHPHQVGLFIDDMYFCGGSLISDEYVLTAGHCCDGAFFIEVVMGAHHISDNEATQQRQTTYDFATHEDWDPNNLANDICWVHLAKITFDSNIQAITLNTARGDPEIGEMVQATGWGRPPSDATGGISGGLQEVTVPVISNEDCNAVYGIIYDGCICTDTEGGTKGTCGGDSGGPLTHADGHLVGITSFGSSRGCETGSPDVFTRVSHFKDWILEKTGVL